MAPTKYHIAQNLLANSDLANSLCDSRIPRTTPFSILHELRLSSFNSPFFIFALTLLNGQRSFIQLNLVPVWNDFTCTMCTCVSTWLYWMEDVVLLYFRMKMPSALWRWVHYPQALSNVSVIETRVGYSNTGVCLVSGWEGGSRGTWDAWNERGERRPGKNNGNKKSSSTFLHCCCWWIWIESPLQ